MRWIDRLCLTLANGLGSGLAPVAPGTFGSVLGIALAWGFQAAGLHWAARAAATAVLFVVGIPICDRAASLLGKDDPGSIVLDEIVAVPLVFLFPLTTITPTTAVLGFLWFRLFDILKLWPANRLEALHGGRGIMADDIVAALYAGLALWLTMFLWTRLS